MASGKALDLTGPRIKIARAKRHIGELESLFDSFVCDNPHRIETKHDPNTGHLVISGVFDRPLPNETSAIIGDAIHNLRAALDHLACEFVRASGNEPCRRTGFPIYGDQAGFNGGIASKLSGAQDKFLDFVRAEEPYFNGQGHCLFVLSKLDNLDKHIVLLPAVSVVSVKNVRATDSKGSPILTIGELTVSGNGYVNAVGLPGEGVKVEADSEATFTVVFTGTDIVDNAPVTDCLHRLRKTVNDVVERAKNIN